jgi:hypothetical protein
LLNIVVAFDAWGGPLPPPTKPTRGKENPEDPGTADKPVAPAAP